MTPGTPGPVLGIDGGHRDRAALEHALLHALEDAGGPQPVLLRTHPVRTGEAHHAASVEFAAGTPAAALTARDFVRPILRGGALVLEVTPAASRC